MVPISVGKACTNCVLFNHITNVNEHSFLLCIQITFPVKKVYKRKEVLFIALKLQGLVQMSCGHKYLRRITQATKSVHRNHHTNSSVIVSHRGSFNVFFTSRQSDVLRQPWIPASVFFPSILLYSSRNDKAYVSCWIDDPLSALWSVLQYVTTWLISDPEINTLSILKFLTFMTKKLVQKSLNWDGPTTL